MYKDLIKLPDGYRLIYLTHFGSRLYGTDSHNSDTDLKGIFIPSREDVLLKRDKDSFNFSTGDRNSKNTSDDIDIELWSIYKFFGLLKKGETGALDLLFSMFRYDTIIEATYENDDIVGRYKTFLSKNTNAFKVYCIQQAKRYGVKGSRYNDLIALKECMDAFDSNSNFYIKNGDVKGVKFSVFVNEYTDVLQNKKYIQYVELDNGKYLNVLGKNFQLDAPYVIVRKDILKLYNNYGERSRKAGEADGVDWKALSHAVRVIVEVEELLTDNFITFPLKNTEYIKSVKYGHESLESVLKYIEDKIQNIDAMVDTSDLPDNPSNETFDKLLLEMI